MKCEGCPALRQDGYEYPAVLHYVKTDMNILKLTAVYIPTVNV